MIAEAELQEYLDEIREQVCSCCVERPPGGPPCAPLGKQCGVEMHLPRLIDAIHEVQSESIEPYLRHNRQTICESCAFLHSGICPCPMDYLLVLAVQAVETVDQRREQAGARRRFVDELPGHERPGMEAVCQAYQAGAGTWTGCDWATHFGHTDLDLNGCTAAEAEALAVEATGTEAADDWAAAAGLLARIERCAAMAESQASSAVRAAGARQWHEALHHATRAWALEFSTGRPLRRAGEPAWKRLRQAVEAALIAHANASEGGAEGKVPGSDT
jgi:hypothetical protein